MAMEQYFQEAVARNDSIKEDESSMEKWKSVSAAVTGPDDNPSAGFDCNICLDFVQDPVVTLCGHLYCWPCIYKWLHLQSISTENPDEQQQQCPVCKAEVSRTTLVPLYGRGKTTKPSEGKAPHLGIVIPRRPTGPACGFDTLVTTPTSPRPAQQLHHRNYPYQYQSQPYYPPPGSYTASPMLSLGGTTTTNMFHPMVGMLGEMVYARVFGNSITNIYSYPNSYNLAGGTSPRVRRHVMQADRSLNRICFFLFCCIFLCLLLF
ncbi:hypothetical protein L1049_023614 [Liquidambar formosana]|uniref:E3 ubiquitin-protein ligase RMA n=1 Tax=Liquidambar formosana TaxID=63359 RepID=A0AAP0X0P9_LIQFO